ncbi:MAG: hypothetical protein RJP95_01105 [Pirellulales bacterium]
MMINHVTLATNQIDSVTEFFNGSPAQMNSNGTFFTMVPNWA